MNVEGVTLDMANQEYMNVMLQELNKKMSGKIISREIVQEIDLLTFKR